jgi:hypothetical protein
MIKEIYIYKLIPLYDLILLINNLNFNYERQEKEPKQNLKDKTAINYIGKNRLCR